MEQTLPALRERYLHLLLTLTGQTVSVTLTNGTILTGILHTATPFVHLTTAAQQQQRFKYVLKAAVTVRGPIRTNGSNNNNDSSSSNNKTDTSRSDSVAVKPGSTVVLDMEQVVQLHCKACRLDALAASHKTSSNGDSFTDTEISRANGAVHNNNNNSNGQARSKELVAVDSVWTSAGDGSTSATLQPLTPINSKAARLAGLSSSDGIMMTSPLPPPPPHNSGLSGSIAGWDQFKANEELFNVKSSFDENVYTTKLDVSQISARERQRAEQIARDIEQSTTTNIHMAEERGQVSSQDYADYDEEDRYSGVLKTTPLASSSTKVAPPKLNYAQAVSKAETTATPSAPPGFSSTNASTAASTNNDKDPASIAETHSTVPSTVDHSDTTKADVESELTPTPAPDVVAPVANMETNEATTESTPNESEVKKDSTADMDSSQTTATTASDTTKEPPVKSSLSASAKSFSFNINAKSFQPTPLPPQAQQQQHLPPPPPPPPPQYMYDPVNGVPLPPMMMPHHMMPGGTCYSCLFVRVYGRRIFSFNCMNSPIVFFVILKGMMPPMMNPGHYPGMRYGGQYPGMEYGQPPPMSHVQQHPMHQHQQQQPIPIPPQSSSQPVPANAGATTTSTTTSSVTTPIPPDDPSASLPTASASDDGSMLATPQILEGDGDATAAASDITAASSSQVPQSVPAVAPHQQQRQYPHQQQQLHHQPHNIPVQPQMYYPGSYYNPVASMGMYPPQTMPPQQHGQVGGPPQQQQYMPAHMAAQMQRQMYGAGPGIPGSGMPPNMMRGPPQAYYPGPNGPTPYPQYVPGGGMRSSDDDMNGNMNNGYGRGSGGRGGRGPGRGGRNSGGRGQGRGMNSNSSMSGRSGGRGGRYNHQYSGGSNSLGDSGRETPSDNNAQPPPPSSGMVKEPNEASLTIETPVNVDFSANDNSNNKNNEVSTPSNRDEAGSNVNATAAIDTSVVPTVTPTDKDSTES